MDELCIELSTLKTHINKIYKILGITSRQQIKKVENLRLKPFMPTIIQKINLFQPSINPINLDGQQRTD
ncbi:MAG: hypothetical protein IPK57_09345 [Chitinophagaceae bacterium]|nr:hypothetical protein [Chitinophagaceae bacterium]